MIRPVDLLRRYATMVSITALAVLIAGAACGKADVPSPATQSDKSELHIAFGPLGPERLTYRDVVLLDVKGRDAVDCPIVHWTEQPPGQPLQDQWSYVAPAARHWNADAHRLTLTVPWGSVDCDYAVTTDRLNITITIYNRGDQPLAGVDVYPLDLTFPRMPDNFNGWPQARFGYDAPAVLVADYGSGALALCNEDIGRPTYTGMMLGNNHGTTAHYRVRVGTVSRGPFAPAGWPPLNVPLKARSQVTYNLSLRFGPSGTVGADLAPDCYQRFAAMAPQELRWPDRRPVGMLMPADSAPASRSLTNPRGWFNNPAVDITTPAGSVAFRNQFLAYANASIRILKSMNAQGVITWDIEGEQFAQANYVGDPRVVDQFAPELAVNGTVDEYFRRFRNAGLKIGVTIRPQVLTRTSSGWTQVDPSAPADKVKLLVDKIDYAKHRWGCTLFYVDSNDDHDADVIRDVARAEPDVLLMPEHGPAKIYAYAARYGDWKLGYHSTPPEVRRLYPSAFSIITAPADWGPQTRSEVLSSLKDGDSTLFHGWYSTPGLGVLRDLYRQAHPTTNP